VIYTEINLDAAKLFDFFQLCAKDSKGYRKKALMYKDKKSDNELANF